MDKTDPPESFGIFKPVGHIVMSFRGTVDLEAAASALTKAGFAAKELVRYTPNEMIAQVNDEIETASPLAAIGQDLNLVKAHRELAESGCSFLVVHAPDDALVDQVTAVARHCKAVTAQRYGRFVVEELIDDGSGLGQTSESSDTGLDDHRPHTKHK
jgi:hypothetical protein